MNEEIRWACYWEAIYRLIFINYQLPPCTEEQLDFMDRLDCAVYAGKPPS